ncbi:MAG: ABC transporter ATP-binding protein [Phototrophicaceae bacterium]
MLHARDITVSFDNTAVLRGVDLRVEPGEIVCLLGPSGCGKTTLLRVIAGLEHADSGSVHFEDQPIDRTPVHARGFGLMFQDFALFPHMDVARNVMFGLKMQGMPNQQREDRMREVLQLVGLADFEAREVTQLSGGERQRVALARSLAPNPRLLMLDEPLGSLDANLRDRLVIDLRAIIKRVGLSAIYVTHDQHEAFAIADRIAIMNAGRIEQIGTPQQLYRQPGTVFVARFLSLNNIVPVLEVNGTAVKTAIGTLELSEPPADGDGDWHLLVHPDGLSARADGQAGVLEGKVIECVFQGSAYRLRVDLGDHIEFEFDQPAAGNHIPCDGDTITLYYDQSALQLLR